MYNTRRHICLTQAVVLLIYFYLPAISLLPLPRFAITCDLKLDIYVFRFRHGPLRKQGLPSAGSKAHVCRLQLVDFDPSC